MKHFKRLAAVLLVGVLALSMLAACGSSAQTATEKYAALVNVFLKGEGNSKAANATVTASKALDNDAAAYAAILKQYVEIPEGTAQDDAKFETNYTVNEKRNQLDDSLSNSKKFVCIVGKYDRLTAEDYGDDGRPHSNKVADSSEKIAQALVYNINWLFSDEDGSPNASSISGIGIAEVTDINDPIWSADDDLNEYGDNYMKSTRKFTGWVVVVSYN